MRRASLASALLGTLLCAAGAAASGAASGCTALVDVRDVFFAPEAGPSEAGCTTACTQVANAVVACVGNECRVSCNEGYRACGARCVAANDVEACGPECVRCDAPANGVATCEADTCGVRCNDGHHPSGTECVPNGSCAGLVAQCGAAGNDDCCASTVVPAGTFNRSNDAGAPATVSAFRLDTYEITVGRFRRFLAEYSRDMIPAGAGRNPNNPNDTGWNSSWNADLPPSPSAFMIALRCAGQPTWTDSPDVNEYKPIGCLAWQEALAFCIWDGGRLPTEAEWNYAAAGGNEQRVYPWGNSAPLDDTALAIYGCHYGTCTVAPVGTPVSGAARWGQLDMAGNAFEWVLDVHADPYPVPCNDCSVGTTANPYRVTRGGAGGSPVTDITTAARLIAGATSATLTRNDAQGARCARAP